MSRVYIIHDNPYSPKNFDPAKIFGTLVPCIVGHASNTQLGEYCDKLDDLLKDIEEEDWIILSGHPVLMSYAASIMVDRTGCLKALVWDQKKQGYDTFYRKVYD